jgi:hypothetical protein
VRNFVALYLAYVAAIHFIDGPWKDWKKGAVVDNWTYTHIAWGMIAKKMGLTLDELFMLEVINEAGEGFVRETRPDLTFGSPESWGNIGADFVSTNVGWHLDDWLKIQL